MTEWHDGDWWCDCPADSCRHARWVFGAFFAVALILAFASVIAAAFGV